MSDYVLCEQCTIRNCNTKPKKTTMGFTCRKRVAYRSGTSLMERAIDNSPEAVLKLVYDFGMQITEGKNGLKLSRREL